MGVIELTNIRIYAYHGCLKEEETIGSDYRVDIRIWADLSTAALTDRLNDTVDYVKVNHIVRTEMETPSKLLEHVAQRILKRLFEEITMIRKVKVKVSKMNPPMGGFVNHVSICLKETRR